MNDRDSNTRAFKMNSQLNTRAQREKRRKRRQAVLITIMVLLAAALIVSLVVICRELTGAGGDTTLPPDSTGELPVFVNSGDTSGDSTTGDVPPESTAPDTTADTTGSSGLSEGYTVKLMSSAEIHRGELILVDNTHQYVFPVTTDFIELRGSRSEKWGTSASGKIIHSFSCAYDIMLTARTALNLNRMFDDFYDATKNQDIYLTENSGYRSGEVQDSLYSDKPSAECPQGCSEHHTGLSVDVRAWLDNGTFPYITSSDTSCVQIYSWLNANCYKYGFIQRYPESKFTVTKSNHYACHYRYVGYPHALAMMRNDLCLEEYLAVLAARHTYEGTHYIINGEDGVTYEIYYVPAETADGAITSVPVPTSLPYTVSGNNYDGFIVTVTRN